MDVLWSYLSSESEQVSVIHFISLATASVGTDIIKVRVARPQPIK